MGVLFLQKKYTIISRYVYITYIYIYIYILLLFFFWGGGGGESPVSNAYDSLHTSCSTSFAHKNSVYISSVRVQHDCMLKYSPCLVGHSLSATRFFICHSCLIVYPIVYYTLLWFWDYLMQCFVLYCSILYTFCSCKFLLYFCSSKLYFCSSISYIYIYSCCI